MTLRLLRPRHAYLVDCRMEFLRPGFKPCDASRPQFLNLSNDPETEFLMLRDGEDYLLAIRHPDKRYLLDFWSGGGCERSTALCDHADMRETLIRYFDKDASWRDRHGWQSVPPGGLGGMPVAAFIVCIYAGLFGGFSLGAIGGVSAGSAINPDNNLLSIVFALIGAPLVFVFAYYGVRRLRARCPRCTHQMRWRYPGQNFVFTCSNCGHVHISTWGIGAHGPPPIG